MNEMHLRNIIEERAIARGGVIAEGLFEGPIVLLDDHRIAKFVTLTSGGVKDEGEPYEMFETIDEAKDSFIKEFEHYVQGTSAFSVFTLFWREYPELVMRVEAHNRWYVKSRLVCISGRVNASLIVEDEMSDKEGIHARIFCGVWECWCGDHKLDENKL